jgi:hypothetical protein
MELRFVTISASRHDKGTWYTSQLVITTILLTDIIIVLVAIALGISTTGKPSRYFGEGRFTTFVSCVQLLAVTLLSTRIFLARRSWIYTVSPSAAAWVWSLIAGGFAFLAADEALQIHERLDLVIHKALNIRETALTDRLDDAIIAIYALFGVGILWYFRRELLFFKPSGKLLGAGFVCLFGSVLCDALSNDEVVIVLLLGHTEWSTKLVQWIAVGDGSFTLIAEGFFVAAFYLSYRATSIRCNGSGTAYAGV